MRFEWDPAKAASNVSKHGISFEMAVKVFSDSLARSVQDRYVGGEERWQTLGAVNGIVLLLVVHTWHDDNEAVLRIISARRATKQERRIYERGR